MLLDVGLMVEVVDAGRGSQSQLFSIETRLIHFVTDVFIRYRETLVMLIGDQLLFDSAFQ